MQIPIAFGASHDGATQWQTELAWIRRAVDVIGDKEVAYALDIGPSLLSDALVERERKYLKAKWVSIIVRMAPPEMQAEWVRLTADPLGFKMPERKRAKTPEERDRERDAWLAVNAPGLRAQMNKELGE